MTTTNILTPERRAAVRAVADSSGHGRGSEQWCDLAWRALTQAEQVALMQSWHGKTGWYRLLLRELEDGE